MIADCIKDREQNVFSISTHTEEDLLDCIKVGKYSQLARKTCFQFQLRRMNSLRSGVQKQTCSTCSVARVPETKPGGIRVGYEKTKRIRTVPRETVDVSVLLPLIVSLIQLRWRQQEETSIQYDTSVDPVNFRVPRKRCGPSGHRDCVQADKRWIYISMPRSEQYGLSICIPCTYTKKRCIMPY